MSQKESSIRRNLIVKKLRKYAATAEEILDYLDEESEIQEADFRISKRTLQRDIKDIRAIYNIDIQFDFSKKTYSIISDYNSPANERILEAFDLFNALSINERLSNHIHFEDRKPQGTDNLNGLLHGIKQKVQIKFTYSKYWCEDVAQRTIEPYALKEFKNRWYVLGRDLKDGHIKSFGLDRLTNLEITNKKRQSPNNFDVNAHFNHCFGIISPNAEKPTEVILSFNSFQGKYIKSLPLHHSQQVLIDDENELRIKLKLFITHDFLMEILSYGDNLKVIKPDSLVDKLKTTFTKVLEKYN